MAVNQNYLTSEHYTEKQKRSAQRLIESLVRTESRLSDHYSQVRSHQRQVCRNILLIRIPNGENTVGFSVYMRDISASGTSFLYPGVIEAQEILVGIPVTGREPTWFQGKVVRCKQVMNEDFWDYGVKFLQRLS